MGIKAWNGLTEVENIADMENDGFEESWRHCRECGTRLMERIEDVGYSVDEITIQCPYCGFFDVVYED